MARRVKGEGTVYAYGKGFRGRLRYKDPTTGRQKEATFSGKTRQEVLQRLSEARQHLKRGRPAKALKVSLQDWLTRWANTSLENSERKETTKQTYRHLIKLINTHEIAHKDIGRVLPADIENLLASLRAAGRSSSARRQVFTILNLAFAHAVRNQQAVTNPVELVERPQQQRREAAFLEPNQVVRILNESSGTRYRLALELIAYLGLRRGEALGLQWSDVEFDDALLRVRHTLSAGDNGPILSAPKTRNSLRDLALSPALVEKLEFQRIAQAQDRELAGTQWHESNFVFTTRLGSPVNPRNLLRAYSTAAKKAAVRDSSIHSLRHSFAAALLADGVPIFQVSRILGHGNISITADTYGHIAPSKQQESLEKARAILDDAFVELNRSSSVDGRAS